MGIMKKEKFWGDLGKFDPNLKTSKCGFWAGICPGFKVKKWLNFESIFGQLIVYFLGNFSPIAEWFLAVVTTQFLRQLLADGDEIFIHPRVDMELYWRKIDAYFWCSNDLIFGSFLLQSDAFLKVKNDVISGAKLSSF